jgi:hypothetical protein
VTSTAFSSTTTATPTVRPLFDHAVTGAGVHPEVVDALRIGEQPQRADALRRGASDLGQHLAGVLRPERPILTVTDR